MSSLGWKWPTPLAEGVAWLRGKLVWSLKKVGAILGRGLAVFPGKSCSDLASKCVWIWWRRRSGFAAKYVNAGPSVCVAFGRV